MEALAWIAVLFTAMLAVYALIRCLNEEGAPWHSKLVFSILILLLPVLGAVLYFRQREELERIRARDKRRRRYR